MRETDVLEHDDLAADLPVSLPDRGTHMAEGAPISLNPFQMATLRIAR